MIEFIKGEVAELTPTYAVIDCGGVGYMASISLNTYSALEGKAEAKLFIQEAIREDAYQLFGFESRGEREAFRLLTSVSGVGSQTARIMLSALTAAELKSVIMSGNVATLKGIKGIGLKTAERIVVELKDKMAKADFGEQAGSQPQAGGPSNAVNEEALQALEVLGYNKAQAAKAVDKILAADPNLKVEGVVKAAFKML